MLLAGVQCAKLAKEQLHQKQKGEKKEVDVSYLYACVSDGLTYLFKTWNDFFLMVTCNLSARLV